MYATKSLARVFSFVWRLAFPPAMAHSIRFCLRIKDKIFFFSMCVLELLFFFLAIFQRRFESPLVVSLFIFFFPLFVGSLALFSQYTHTHTHFYSCFSSCSSVRVMDVAGRWKSRRRKKKQVHNILARSRQRPLFHIVAASRFVSLVGRVFPWRWADSFSAQTTFFLFISLCMMRVRFEMMIRSLVSFAKNTRFSFLSFVFIFYSYPPSGLAHSRL